MTEALAGPYCAMLLGDFGADVIKVERPGAGDQSRGWGSPLVGSESAYYFAANRNKRSITLNYDDPRGAEALQKLLESADVFIINQPSLASLQKRGIDPDSLCANYPRLIYCDIIRYGLASPKAGTQVSYRLPPPLLGEHTAAILPGPGYSAEDTRAIAAETAA
jgi:crotonobetainyl-CoA:carnitine CoA-transferase CaiB-like acyl-CoA transferase